MTALADRVKETTATTGTGSLTLSGAVPQFESFSTAFGTANPFYYVITDANGTDWEVGTGELSNATTLVRTTVHQSSNADAKISLSSGTHTVFCSAPAVFLADLASKTGKLSQFAATTSAELAGVISDETGSGALVFATSPTLTTPNIGVATATSVNGTTIPASKTLVVTTDKLSALAATTSAELAGVVSDETGSGSLVFATSPTLVTPNIGAATATSVNGTTIPSSKTLVVTTDKLSALAATTSAELAGVISDETGTGSLVFATSPTLTTPNIGAATATSINSTTIPTSKTLVVTTDKLSALAATTSAELAGVVSDETGSGSLVFATSPTLTTPNIGTPSAGTLTNCTGLPVGGVSGLGTGVGTALAVNTGSSGAFVVNGGALGTPSSGTVTNLTGTASININGTVGATTPNTGSFTSLTDSGNLTFTGTGNRITGDFSNATLSNRVAFQTSTASGNTTVIFLPNATSGSATLGAFNSNDPANASYLNAGVFGTTDVSFRSGITGTGSYLPMTFYTGGSERMRLDTSGNVGIGTNSPGTKLDVNGKIRLSGGEDQQLEWVNNSQTWRLNNSTGGQFYLYDVTGAKFPFKVSAGAASDSLVITSSGNVGIGTSSPSALLDVNGNVAITGTARKIIGDFSNATVANRTLFQTSTANATTEVGIVPNGTGTAAVLNIYPNSDPSNTGYMRLACLSTDVRFLSQVTGSGTFLPMTFYVNGERMRITDAGELLIGTTTDNGAYLLQVNSQIFATNATIATSDARLKENVAPITNALDTIGKVQAVAFDFKQDTEYNFDTARQTGFIAQDLQVALANEDYKNSIVKECGPYLGVAYEKMIPVLVAAIQELKAEVDLLKTVH